MNKARRKAIEEIGDQLETLAYRIGEIRDEEQEYIDNMPESLQGGEKARKAEFRVSRLEEAASSLNELYVSMNEAAI